MNEKNLMKTKFYKIFYPENGREIMGMVSHIFFQLFFAAIIAQVNVLMFSWYDGDGYFAAMNKVTILFTTLQFIPSLIASGTLVVGGNLIGQGRQKEIPTVIKTGILVNIGICLVIFAIVEAIAPMLLEFVGATEDPIIGATFHQFPSELDFVSKYFRIQFVQLMIMAVAQVYIASLQIIKKQKHVAIGAIISNIIDVTFIALILYVFNANPLLTSLAIPLAALFQMFYMMFMYYKYYYDKENKASINLKFAKETIMIGLPITLEIALARGCMFAMNGAIAGLPWETEEIKNSFINLHRTIDSINQYSNAFLQAIGTVTSIMVAKKIGEQNKEEAFRTGLNAWRISIYGQLVLSILTFALIYPLLLGFNIPTEMIVNYGIVMFGVLFIKYLFDTVNMTLLRALWSVGDLWTPLIVSIFTMVIGMVALPWLITKTFTGEPQMGIILIYILSGVDPISRSIIYSIRWFKKKWFKHVKLV
ncbi:MATE family efflux transporter [Mesoplasma photuris]|uniref:MATE family efflux transporter n=1 Tax=Mesoplasma photuris TaxID=217731 RepID=UPI0004E156CF|nr:MATE family efflux transporter [Mesoplasma photuris]